MSLSFSDMNAGSGKDIISMNLLDPKRQKAAAKRWGKVNMLLKAKRAFYLGKRSGNSIRRSASLRHGKTAKSDEEHVSPTTKDAKSLRFSLTTSDGLVSWLQDDTPVAPYLAAGRRRRISPSSSSSDSDTPQTSKRTKRRNKMSLRGLPPNTPRTVPRSPRASPRGLPPNTPRTVPRSPRASPRGRLSSIPRSVSPSPRRNNSVRGSSIRDNSVTKTMQILVKLSKAGSSWVQMTATTPLLTVMERLQSKYPDVNLVLKQNGEVIPYLCDKILNDLKPRKGEQPHRITVESDDDSSDAEVMILPEDQALAVKPLLLRQARNPATLPKQPQNITRDDTMSPHVTVRMAPSPRAVSKAAVRARSFRRKRAKSARITEDRSDAKAPRARSVRGLRRKTIAISEKRTIRAKSQTPHTRTAAIPTPIKVSIIEPSSILTTATPASWSSLTTVIGQSPKNVGEGLDARIDPALVAITKMQVGKRRCSLGVPTRMSSISFGRRSVTPRGKRREIHFREAGLRAGQYEVVGKSGCVVRAEQSRASTLVARLSTGTKIEVAEIQGNRMRIVKPCSGWVSFQNSHGNRILKSTAKAPLATSESRPSSSNQSEKGKPARASYASPSSHEEVELDERPTFFLQKPDSTHETEINTLNHELQHFTKKDLQKLIVKFAKEHPLFLPNILHNVNTSCETDI